MQQPFSLRKSIQFIKDNRSRMFWLWVTYQAIKGSITLTFIWIPLFLLWKNSGGLQSFLPDWGRFVAANLTFVLSHMILMNGKLKTSISRLTGDLAYRALYSVLSVVVFTWCVIEAIRAPQDVVWNFEIWHGIVAIILVLLGLGLIGLGIGAPNKFSIMSRADGYSHDHPGVVRVTRHPVIWGLGLWAGGHILANGQIGVLIFFVIQLAFALIGAVMLDKRAKRQLAPDETWGDAIRHTSFLPNPLGLIQAISNDRQFLKSLLVRLTVTSLLAIMLLMIHYQLFGVSPLASIGFSFG